jgi:hypothetical protein
MADSGRGHDAGRRRGGRTRAGLVAALLLPCWLAAAPAPLSGQAAPPAASEETPEMYPEGAHREETFYFCTACHSFRIVAAQGMSRERWSESLEWMTQRHNMPRLEGAEREQVLDYLATVFPERRGPQRGWKNPFSP